jgi:hypothetical protein
MDKDGIRRNGRGGGVQLGCRARSGGGIAP